MTKSIYENISEMNTAFGNIKGLAIENGQIKEAKFSKLLNQSRNIYGEIDELREKGFDVLLKDAKDVEGRKELFDAMADILVFLNGVGHFINEEPQIQPGERFDKLPTHYLIGDENSAIEKLEFGTQDFATRYYDMIKHHTDLLISAVHARDVNEIVLTFKQIDFDVLDLFNKVKKEGYTREELIDRVTASNMSKLCKNEEETNKTLEYYREREIEVHSDVSPLRQANGEPFYVVYSSKNQTDKYGKTYTAGKFLKNTTWFEPDLYDF